MASSNAQRARGAEGWLDWLLRLIAEELAPRPRRIATALRYAIIATVAVGLMAACHVDSALGPYVIWILLGGLPMVSLRKAVGFLVVEGALLALSVPIAGMLIEVPWLMLPALGAIAFFATRFTTIWKLGAFGLVLEVTVLDTFYSAVFAPNDFGSEAASLYGGAVIALLVLAAFDSWIWPAPAEAILIESLGASDLRMRQRLLSALNYYFDEQSARRPPNPAETAEMAAQLALLNRAAAEGLAPQRRAVLLAAIGRGARIHVAIDRLIFAVREPAPRYVRDLLRAGIESAAAAIADALAELAREVAVQIRTGPDEPPSPAAARVRAALDALDARVVAARPAYITQASIAEVSALSAINENLIAIGQLLERPLDAPPAPAAGGPPLFAMSAPSSADSALTYHSIKVAICVVAGYVIGIAAHRPELGVIVTTVIVTVLPTFGASVRKMILRVAGTIIGGLIVLAAIVIVTPNFETLPVYMIATFIVLLVSAYAAQSSGRIAYAGKLIGTTFLLVFAGLSPSLDVYTPLWRLWGILLGTLIGTLVMLLLWPVYAGDSLMPRLRRVLRDVLALVPQPPIDEVAIRSVSHEAAQLLGEILEVADDARLEGRKSLVNHDAVVDAASTLRRIAHRLASIAIAESQAPPRLDALARTSRDAILAAIRARLNAWLALYDGPSALSSAGAHALAASHSRDEIARPLARLGEHLEADGFAAINGLPIDLRRRILAELQSLRRLEFLMFELDRYMAAIPSAAQSPAFSTSLQPASL